MKKNDINELKNKLEDVAVTNEKSKGLVLTIMDMWEEVAKLANSNNPETRKMTAYEVDRIALQMEILQGMLLDLIIEEEKAISGAALELSGLND